ncbi:MAG: hypothetical protein BroJett024_23340 [Alphaproteobacteria bacterium]|nr:MAG: hypothetical protein BroJett024_23340 [Alphaproteobacteria bacterium]
MRRKVGACLAAANPASAARAFVIGIRHTPCRARSRPAAKPASRPHVIPALRKREGAGIVFKRNGIAFDCNSEKRSRLSLRSAGTTINAAYDPGSAAHRCALRPG